MSTIKHISIPQPCSQSWQEMEEREQGRYCLHCAKTVIDFSKMTNDEILSYLAGTTRVCGRFNQAQLTAINDQLKALETVKTLNWKRWFIAAGIFGAGLMSRTNAQTIPEGKPFTEQSPVDSGREILTPADSVNNKTKIIHISGRIIGSDDKLPVVGASIRIKGTNTGAVTDVQGCFELAVPDPRSVLIISYIGYQTKEIKLSKIQNKAVELKLSLEPSWSGGIDVTYNTPASRVIMFNQYMPWPINRLFK